jgi:hypothetical protein
MSIFALDNHIHQEMLLGMSSVITFDEGYFSSRACMFMVDRQVFLGKSVDGLAASIEHYVRASELTI